MKSLQQRFTSISGKIRDIDSSEPWESVHQYVYPLQKKLRVIEQVVVNSLVAIGSAVEQAFATIAEFDQFSWIRHRLLHFTEKLRTIGFTPDLDHYEKRKLGVFNLLNFFQIVSAIIIPLTGMISNSNLPSSAWLVTMIPAMISLVVLWLNDHRRYELAVVSYFILYPIVTSVVYMNGMNIGVELFFVLYGILSVFFLQQVTHMLFSVSLSMISYFILSVVWKVYPYQLESTNLVFYLFNELSAIIFIFYGLFLVKKENSSNQERLLKKNRILIAKNDKIERQRTELAANAILLEKQTAELTELNSVKNKLFSVIAHDLKSPMYALRNLFRNMQQQDLPAKQVKAMVPEILKDLDFTTSLMDNLLHWAKCQMQSNAVNIKELNIQTLIMDVTRLLRLQAEAKQISIVTEISEDCLGLGDKDMIELVIRNLVSNALKFTPQKGLVTVGAAANSGFVEIYVKDNGCGMSPEVLEKIKQNDYYTSKGTSDESGTGLGLMICREFISKNGGRLFINSGKGKGSTFSFTLAAPE